MRHRDEVLRVLEAGRHESEEHTDLLVSRRGHFEESREDLDGLGTVRVLSDVSGWTVIIPLTFRPRCSKISLSVLNTPSEVRLSALPPFPIVMKSASSTCPSCAAIAFFGAFTTVGTALDRS